MAEDRREGRRSSPPATGQLAHLMDQARDLHRQLDLAREQCRESLGLIRELQGARSELDRLRSEASRRAECVTQPDRPRSEEAPAEQAPAEDSGGRGDGIAAGSAGPDVPADVGANAAPVGLEIPGYRVLGKLREGSMGTLYRARQLSVDRVVVVKVLRDAFARDKEYTRRFWGEARLAAQLAHPNVVTTLDAGEVGGRPYLVMEEVEGETIQDRLAREGPFEEREAARVALAVAQALGHAHRRGLVHRDIKPDNVILTPDGTVKLTDMGLARPTGDEGWALAEAGLAVGTPHYISPEQVRGQVDLDIRSDLYSLGATLYHMVTGRVPYGGETTPEAMRRHVDPRTPLTPPDALNPRLTGGLVAIIRKLLTRNREGRYRSPSDLILDLERVLGGDRPLIAEGPPDALAPLAVGDSAGAGPVIAERRAAAPEAEALASAPVAADRGWGVLIAVPSLVLALALLGTLVLLVAG